MNFFFSCRTQKYEAKLQNIQKRASKLTRDLASRKKEVAESISEILEKRLILKEHVAEKEDVVHKPSMEIAPITKEMIVCSNFLSSNLILQKNHSLF